MPIFRVRDENGNTHDIPAIKGEPGYTPIKGLDYLTDEELAEVEERFCNSVADKITAENVGARPNTWTPTAEEVGARPADWMPTATDVGARPNTWMPTADDVGARPNTWMPTAEDVGARPNTWMPTAEDVGARPNTWIPTAEDVGARPDTWMPTIAEIGAAPADYGLGALSGQLINTDCNEATKNGWYYVSGAENAAHNTDHAMLVVAYGNNAVTQIAFMGTAYSANTVIMTRKKTSAWQPWEYLNPPMAAGVEYRTTERRGGAPVYTKLIAWTSTLDFAGAVNASVPHGISNIDVSTARIETTSFYSNYDLKDGVSSAWVFPHYSISSSEALYVQKITDAEIIVRSEGGASWDKGRTFYFILKYCKK